MRARAFSAVKIYDPETGRLVRLEPLITRLGIAAVAKKYEVTESAVQKWRRKVHKPATRTLDHSSKKLF